MTARACQQALDAMFKADPEVQAVLGNPVRLLEAPVKLAAYPYAVWRRWETKPVDVSLVRSDEHIATLEVVCRQPGAEAAREALTALMACAGQGSPNASGARIVLVLPLYGDVLRSSDGKSWLGIMRLKIIADRI